MGNEIEKPRVLKPEHLTYLDKLRNSGGRCNMWGARPFLRRKFKYLTNDTAADILIYWMRTYSRRKRENETM